MADEGVAIKLGAFEQEALVDGFSTSASAGLNATLNSLSKWLVAAVFGIIFLWRHDAEALWAASGSILNAGLSTVLKRILNQERPVSTIRSDPGMPSSHAQSIFYTVMFCIVSSNILSQLDEENMLGGRIFRVKWNHCSHKRTYLCNWLLLVMASGFATTPHNQPSSRRLDFRRKLASFPHYTTHPLSIAIIRRATARDEDVGVSFEKEAAFIDGFSSFTSDGLNATLNSLSKWLVAALFGVIFLWRHDAEALWAASGSVLNAGLSTVLKRILNQERPVSTIRSDPGMPSSHAQSIFFTVTFCIVSMIEYFGLNGITAVISTLIFAIGSYFSWLRVSQQLHTTSQVVVGATLGFCYSIFWFWLWDAIVLETFISHLWIRILVVLGTAAICAGFLLYVIRYWVLEEINIYY